MENKIYEICERVPSPGKGDGAHGQIISTCLFRIKNLNRKIQQNDKKVNC